MDVVTSKQLRPSTVMAMSPPKRKAGLVGEAAVLEDLQFVRVTTGGLPTATTNQLTNTIAILYEIDRWGEESPHDYLGDARAILTEALGRVTAPELVESQADDLQRAAMQSLRALLLRDTRALLLQVDSRRNRTAASIRLQAARTYGCEVEADTVRSREDKILPEVAALAASDMRSPDSLKRSRLIRDSDICFAALRQIANEIDALTVELQRSQHAPEETKRLAVTILYNVGKLRWWAFYLDEVVQWARMRVTHDVMGATLSVSGLFPGKRTELGLPIEMTEIVFWFWLEWDGNDNHGNSIDELESELRQADPDLAISVAWAKSGNGSEQSSSDDEPLGSLDCANPGRMSSHARWIVQTTERMQGATRKRYAELG